MKSLVLALVFFFTACQLPQWRVFQKKVDPAMGEKPPAQVEGEKRAAAYIVAATQPPVKDPGAAVADVHEVATGLSASLGQPAKTVTVEDREAIIASLRAGLLAKDKQLDAWRAFGRKYARTPLEGTGINLAGPAGLLGLVLVVAACVACPPIGYALVRVLPLLWGFFRRVTSSVAELAKSNSGAADALKATLSKRMDEAHKTLVERWAAPAKVNPTPS